MGGEGLRGRRSWERRGDRRRPAMRGEAASARGKGRGGVEASRLAVAGCGAAAAGKEWSEGGE